MMSMGKHVIATNYSAHTEFCNEHNTHLIQVDDLERAVDNLWFHGEGQWANFGPNQMDQLVSHMRQVHADVKDGKLVNQAGIVTAERFTWKAAAERVARCLTMDGSDR